MNEEFKTKLTMLLAEIISVLFYCRDIPEKDKQELIENYKEFNDSHKGELK